MCMPKAPRCGGWPCGGFLTQFSGPHHLPKITLLKPPPMGPQPQCPMMGRCHPGAWRLVFFMEQGHLGWEHQHSNSEHTIKSILLLFLPGGRAPCCLPSFPDAQPLHLHHTVSLKYKWEASPYPTWRELGSTKSTHSHGGFGGPTEALCWALGLGDAQDQRSSQTTCGQAPALILGSNLTQKALLSGCAALYVNLEQNKMKLKMCTYISASAE